MVVLPPEPVIEPVEVIAIDIDEVEEVLKSRLSKKSK